MTNSAIVHETIALEHNFRFTPVKVFEAWADPVARTKWGPPSDGESIEFLETDFRVRGRDISRCGPKGNLRFQVETHYYDIVPNSRIVFSETVSENGTPLSVSLMTMTLGPTSEGSCLSLVIQIASLVGGGMVAGNRDGWNDALRNLDRYVAG